MTPEQIDEVWSLLDRAALVAIARRGPEPVFATVSGAHLYGFASPDSDVDLRGVILLSARELLGLSRANETITLSEKTPDLDLGWVAHDLRKFARLMTGHNGYVLEQLYSPLVVITSPEHDELRELGKGCVTRGLFRHYQGFAHGRRQRLVEPDPTVKHLLYAYRVYLSGIAALESGVIDSNVLCLNERFRLSEIDALVERKRGGAEAMRLQAGEVEAHARKLDALEERLIAAHRRSSLPEEPTTRDALEDLVVRVRLQRALA
ncbi:MAG: DNA polymerase beta superfamily protein [Planctomycetota bacterium]